MADSILTGTKKALGITEDYTAFDVDIIMHINSVFSTLNHLGVGPEGGFRITDKTATWFDYVGSDLRFSSLQTYTYLKVRMLFDPPSTSFTQAAFQKQIDEYEWRFVNMKDTDRWAASQREIPFHLTNVDGGTV